MLRQLSEEELKITATDLKMEVDGVEKRNLLRALYDMFDNISTDDDKLKLFTRLSVPTRINKPLENLLTIFLEPTSKKEENPLKTTNTKENGKDSKESFSLDQMNLPASIYRRVFKIIGVIGGGIESRNKELNYINLCSQINDGKKQGFKDVEIIAALKKAVSAGSNLRTYFDSREDLSLEQMLQFLRSFFREKSPAELFTELNSVCQGSQEEATTFLMKAFEIRQKVIVASEAETSVPYDIGLIQNTFLRSVLTGLRDETLRSHMKPFLNPNKPIDDSILIQEMNKAASEVQEREMKQKQQASGKRVRVETNATDAMSDFSAALKPLVDSMAAMQSEIAGIKKNIGQREQQWNERRMCESCREGNKEFCYHCWHCGKGDHIARFCKDFRGELSKRGGR